MTTDIIKPEDLTNILRDKVRASFMELIPDEKWDEMVNAEWTAFFSEKQSDHYPYNKEPSRFRYMIRNEMSRQVMEKIKPLLHQKVNECQDWNVHADEALNAIVAGAGDAVMKGFVKGLVQHITLELQQVLSR
ncbi:MAG: hypothetical protein CMK74_14720 [Pseudomonadales bacterium]|nr:hypothetical protein [Pseudomonadales bacterium]|tara:strand:+ start:406 stop:804 length:399 start_codon:yes stop_codon:yes gene_type:complete